jgi:hypothetical protein
MGDGDEDRRLERDCGEEAFGFLSFSAIFAMASKTVASR